MQDLPVGPCELSQEIVAQIPQAGHPLKSDPLTLSQLVLRLPNIVTTLENKAFYERAGTDIRQEVTG